MEEFRSDMGWGEQCPPYVLKTYESAQNEEKARELGNSSDLVIMGTAPEYYIEPRIAENKIVFRYSERPLKEGFIKFFIPRLTKKYIHLHVRNKNRKVFILAASAFAAYDFKKMFGSYPDKCYKFAYFPKHISYDINELFARKKRIADDAGAVTVLWEGRMIRLKRADILIRAAARLRSEGLDFRLKLIGDGEEKEKLISLAKKLGISDIVTFEGFLSPDEARDRMADAEVYVMTSNKLEGWGSVIYEALNAGCAVVASDAAGAADTSSTEAKKSAGDAKTVVDNKAKAEKEAKEEADRQGVADKTIPKLKISKPSVKKATITAKWKKLTSKQLKKSKATKIEVWVCPNKSFRKADTKIVTVSKKKASAKVKGLKRKTKYFVKVRAIKYVGNVKKVGPWSKTKPIKTK